MQELLEGKEVVIPSFNFVEGKKEYGGKPKKLGAGDVLVIEGIHCLNPKLTEQLSCLPRRRRPRDQHEFHARARRDRGRDIRDLLDVLVIEGIHCLNPKLTEQLSDENKFKIYISALTQLRIC